MGKLKSSFSGYINEIPFIHVDNFENKHKSAYFLSHYHGDHVIGLKDADFPEKLERNNGFIYASEVSVAIIANDYPELSPFLKVLVLGTNTITITENDQEIYLTVITLPAGHSLGSVMFLFKHKHTVLYSGDFRITPNTVAKYTHLHKNNEPITIDTLYIDTTFQSVPSFPKRSDVMRNLIVYVENWLKADINHKVLFVTSAGYGYECVCNEFYNATKIKTFISERKWQVFSQFPKELYGITNDPSSRLKMCTKYDNLPTSPNTLSIYFSAMKWSCNQENDEKFIKVINKNRIDVCFSLHCDRNELVHFINYLQPKKVVGFPEDFVGYKNDMPVVEENLDELFLKRKRRVENSDESINKKISKEISKNMFDW